jgi:hypothetical protein
MRKLNALAVLNLASQLRTLIGASEPTPANHLTV